MAAHRNLVLLRLDSFVDPRDPSPFGEIVHDYFIYIADPPQATPVLRRLPSYTKYNAYYGRPLTFPFEFPGVGLLCCGEEFALAYLNVCLGYTSSSEEELDSPSTLEGTLWVLRSTVSDDSAAGGEKWEVKSVPIHLSHADDYKPLLTWKTNEVVPFKNGLCWVDYNRGILHCEDVCGDNPKVSFISFAPNFRCDSTLRSELYRSLCVTGSGCTLAFLDVRRHDGAALDRMAPGSGFTITNMTLTDCGEGTNDFAVQASELWATHTPEELRREVMMIPLLSMDEPNVAHFVLYDWAHKVGKFSLVTIDLSTKQVVGSVVPYINGEQDLSTDDADMVNAKPYFFMHFLPTEFPKFLNLHR